jgi:hypothetical protein
MDALLERTVVAVAHALFMNRLHVLRLTEVVRLGIKPDEQDGTMQLPAGLDAEMRQQAVDYVLTCLPEEFAQAINQAKTSWLRPD